MKRATYRTKLQMYIDFLNTCKEPLIKSAIGRKVGLSYYKVIECGTELESKGLISISEVVEQMTAYHDKGITVVKYQTTTMGNQAIDILERAENIIKVDGE